MRSLSAAPRQRIFLAPVGSECAAGRASFNVQISQVWAESDTNCSRPVPEAGRCGRLFHFVALSSPDSGRKDDL